MKAIIVGLLMLLASISVCGQREAAGRSTKGLEATWKGLDLSIVRSVLKKSTQKPANSSTRTPSKPAKAPARPATANAARFIPQGDSGVPLALAPAFSMSPSETSDLKTFFDTVKQAYEVEVSKENKSNNVAAALTFFVATNAMVYNDTPEPTDEETEQTFRIIEDTLNASAQFRAISNAQKQQMHDWLVCAAGFALFNYQQSKRTNDAAGLKTIKEFSKAAMQIVLGSTLDLPGMPN